MASLGVHQITGDLSFDELIVRHVVVERLDHPVAINVGIRIGIEATSHGVEAAIVVFTVTGHVEPHTPPTFAVMGRGLAPELRLRTLICRIVQDYAGAQAAHRVLTLKTFSALL